MSSTLLDRIARHRRALFVALVTLGMVAVALACIGRYGWDVPLAEDWHLVPVYTGSEPDVAGWLWAQNNEHRVPLPRLVYLALLGLAGGDFRVGMVYNVLVLGALSLVLALAARRLRGGQSRYADAFFPLLLLHIGHWPNLVWGWQLQFVTAVALTLGALLILLRPRPLSTRAALVAGICLVLLPLCGANGILYALALAPWFAFEGVALGRSPELTAGHRRAGWALVGLAVLSVAVVGLYFVGYERADWNPPPPSIAAAAQTAASFVAMGFGPAVKAHWTFWIVVTLAGLAATAFVLVRAAMHSRGAERRRALGLVFFAAACGGVALAVGWGRSGLVPEVGMPARYALMSAPTLVAAYFVWVLYGPRRIRHGVALVLLVVSAALIVPNTRVGFGWRNWYVGGMQAVERDLEAGLPAAELAERHREFLLHWDQGKLEAGMRMLKDAGLGPFRHMHDSASPDDPSEWTRRGRKPGAP